jgi:NTE family protein
MLVVGVRNEAGDEQATAAPPQKPSFAQIAGYMLDTLFMDGLYSDLERMTRINQLIDSVPPDERHGALTEMRPLDTMVVVPSEDLREVARRHRSELPVAIRAILRGISGRQPGENRLLSYLLFEAAYTRELIELGYRDAMQIKDELTAFVRGESVQRLFAPTWMRRDLASIHGEDSGGTE